jgi:hypothetical protein
MSEVRLNPISIGLAGSVVESKKSGIKFDTNGEEALKITAKS